MKELAAEKTGVGMAGKTAEDDLPDLCPLDLSAYARKLLQAGGSFEICQALRFLELRDCYDDSATTVIPYG